MPDIEKDVLGRVYGGDPIGEPHIRAAKNGSASGTQKNIGFEDRKRNFVVYKYSNKGKGNLFEAIVLDGHPCYLAYDRQNKTAIIKNCIEEQTRLIKPPRLEEYPYTAYEFENLAEIKKIIRKTEKICLDDLYIEAKSIFRTFIDQDDQILTILAADSLWTYFQDMFPVTHYAEGIGDNDVGKSSIGYVFEYTAYRVVRGTSISGANYIRTLGSIEPGQCVIVEDEGDTISEDPEKIKIFKSGYEYNSKTPRINMNSKNQDQNWYYPYSYKLILAEKSLSQLKAKGLIDRTFTFKCRPGKVLYSIKDVVSGTINKSQELKGLYTKLLDFRKLMLCYRLVNYTKTLPSVKTNLVNRDAELAFPLLQLFHGTKALPEISISLEFFLNQRRLRKSNSIETILYPVLSTLIDSSKSENNESADGLAYIPFSAIWNFIILDGIRGKYDSRKPNQFDATDYGMLYQNTLSKLIADKFAATLDRKPTGSFIVFDRKKFLSFKDRYENRSSEIKIKVHLEQGQ